MKNVIITNQDKEPLFTKAQMTTRFFERLVGLMGKNNIEEESALCIKPCNSIHMFFMRFSIDVVFLDAEGSAIWLIEHMKPWQISKIVKKSTCVIEMPCGAIKKKKIKLYDKIEVV